MQSKMRVRQILSSCTGATRASLKKLLPKKLSIPEGESFPYPNALLQILPKDQAYSVLGCIAEDLLRLPVADITLAAINASVLKWVATPASGSIVRAGDGSNPGMPAASLEKVRVSKTTEPFLEHCRKTRAKMDAVIRGGPLAFDQVVSFGSVEGHPDARTATQIFEMKLTGQLKTNWPTFLLQVFAYAALDPAVKDIYLVLPLQETVWHTNVEGWAGRTAYRDLLNTSVETITNSAIISMTLGAALREAYRIGFHAPKAKSLAGTVLSLGDYSKPYQIFLGGPQTTKMTIPDAELAMTAKAVADTGARVYVHSQYIINLCHVAPDGDNWNVDLLRKNLQYAGAAGFRGVVVHVGKSTTRPLPDALNTMRTAVQAVLDAATPDCPLLLETPAGQGTETLTDANEFIDFVSGFADPRFRICLDTCHVFACGHEPIRYLQKLKGRGDLLRLVHYNDSAEPCGSCLDRHAMVGTGHIGIEKMTEVAKFCSAEGVPMVIE